MQEIYRGFLKLNSIKYLMFCSCIILSPNIFGQETIIKGFSAVESSYDIDDDKLSFSFGEQDIFVISELSDKITFLGETVFKYSAGSPTKFNVSVERVLVKYNFSGNHNILVGKHHTPVNYWNDSYHHGRLFFPTIGRPEMFKAKLIPIHTSGVRIQGSSLTKLNFGYDILVGNGIGASDIADNDKTKSLTTAIHVKPVQGIRIGASMYYDRLAAGVVGPNGAALMHPMDHRLYSGSIAAFKKKLEVLAEYTLAQYAMDSEMNQPTSTTHAVFGYLGYRFNRLVPYFRYDLVDVDKNTMYLNNQDISSITVGVRYEVNHMAVVKLEYEYDEKQGQDPYNHMYFQIAIGF